MTPEQTLRVARFSRDLATRRRWLRYYKRQELTQKIQGCERCDLRNTCTQPVPYLWRGDPHQADIAIIGEAPGREEDRLGEPFVGRAGQLLDRCLTQAGIKSVVLMNTICCRPPQNNYNQAEKLGAPEACKPWLDAQLDLSDTWIVVVAGAKALRVAKLGDHISAARGKPLWREGRVWLPIKHPAWYLRQPEQTQQLVEDLTIAADIQKGWQKVPLKDVGGKLGDFGHGEINSRMTHPGWVVVYSHALQDRILVIREPDVKVPATVKDLPTYTLDELIRIRVLGKGQKYPRRELEAMHALKTYLGATVLQ